MKRKCILCLALCAGGLSGAAWAGPCYDVEVLWGPTCGIFGPADVWPEDIASDGTIIGSTGLCDDGATGFVWPITDDPFLIERPAGVTYLYATCTNDTGQVGVQFSIPGDGHIYNVALKSFMPIPAPPGASYNEPNGINNLSQACGRWGAPQNAFVATERGLLDLGPILDGTHSDADGINDWGSIVGWMGSLSMFTTHRGFLYRDGKVIDFGVAPGCINSTARAINQRDEVAAGGGAPTPSGTFARPFLWVEGRWTTIGMLPGFQACQTTDLNDQTVVVGACGNPGEGGYVWVDGVTYDLNDRISPSSNVEIGFALAINNAGQIACEGTTQHPFFGFSRVGVRLTPRPPQPADFTDDCTVDGEDLMILLQSWGPVGKRNSNPAADLDGNGIVNGFDLAMLLAAWG